jgi:hypothetical protein
VGEWVRKTIQRLPRFTGLMGVKVIYRAAVGRMGLHGGSRGSHRQHRRCIGLHGVAIGFVELLWVMWGYMGVHGAATGNVGIHGAATGYTGLKG